MMNIASIMSGGVLPGTFAPDMSTSEAPTVSPIPGLNASADSAAITDAATGAVGAADGVMSFKDTVKAMLVDVNDKLNTSDQNARDLAGGKTNDINKVVTSVEEANLALQYTIAIRTKLMTAYGQINQMSV